LLPLRDGRAANAFALYFATNNARTEVVERYFGRLFAAAKDLFV